MKEDNGLTVLRAENGLRALYKKGKLVTTFLKSELEHEVDVAIEQHSQVGERIQDRIVKINDIFDFPATLEEIKDIVEDAVEEVEEKVKEVKEKVSGAKQEVVKEAVKKVAAVKKAIES